MRDRLIEYFSLAEDIAPDFDIAVIDVPEFDPHLNNFLTQVNEHLEIISDIQNCTKEIKRIQDAIIIAPIVEKASKEEEKRLDQEIQSNAKKVKQFLHSVEKWLKGNENDFSTDIRVKKAQLAALSREFVDVMAGYNSIRSEYKERCKSKIIRQSSIAGKSIDPEELEKRIEDGELIALTHGITIDTGQAKQTLIELEERRDEILRLEESLQQLHEMFTDMVVLIESQGDMIDRIETAVENTREFIERSVAQTKKAMVYQSNTRKKKLILLGVCSAFGVIVAIIILAGTGLL